MFMFTSLYEIYKIFVLYDMHTILESLESDFKCTLINTKINQIACYEHIEQKNTIHIVMASVFLISSHGVPMAQ